MQNSARKLKHGAHGPKLARINDLDRISFLIFSTKKMGDFPILDQFLLNWFIALCKIGFEGIEAPFDFIQGALVRLSRSKRGKSRAVLYAALARLEKAGFITRHKFRIGENHFETRIDFKSKILSHISLSVLIQDKTPCMSNRSTPKVRECFNNKPPRAIDIVPCKPVFDKTEKHKKRDREHPIIKSLQINATGENRRLVLARAFVELFQPGLCSSGLDWPAICRSWPGRTFDERDYFCRDVLIPALEARPEVEPEGPEGPDTRGRFDLGALVAAIAQNNASTGPTVKPAGPECDMSPEDLEILLAAKKHLKWVAPETVRLADITGGDTG